MKACFMGLGYIGLPTAIIAAKHGVQVTGVDINPKVVEMKCCRTWCAQALSTQAPPPR